MCIFHKKHLWDTSKDIVKCLKKNAAYRSSPEIPQLSSPSSEWSSKRKQSSSIDISTLYENSGRPKKLKTIRSRDFEDDLLNDNILNEESESQYIGVNQAYSQTLRPDMLTKFYEHEISDSDSVSLNPNHNRNISETPIRTIENTREMRKKQSSNNKKKIYSNFSIE